MDDQSLYNGLLHKALKDELRLLNVHLPHERKSLADALQDPYPHITCSDGSTHMFKKKELQYLAGMLTPEEQQSLLLPILIRLNAGYNEMTVLCHSDVEKKVLSDILDMPLTMTGDGITIYKNQLGVLRKKLRTTTQYIFSADLSNLAA
jgi:uncharacterized protein (UPF0216 family)